MERTCTLCFLHYCTQSDVAPKTPALKNAESSVPVVSEHSQGCAFISGTVTSEVWSSNLEQSKNEYPSRVQRCKQPTRCSNFSFINLFKSALHVSEDKFAHPEGHFLTVYTAFGTVHYNCSALYQKLYIQSKSAPQDGRICRPKHVGLI